MPDKNAEIINVLVAMDFSDEIMQQIRNLSPRLNVVQHIPNVPESAWADIEVLYTVRDYPEPEQAPMLRWIQLNSAGTERAQQKRIVQSEDVTVTSASGIHAQQMANYCLMMILAFNYKLPRMLSFQQQNEWPKNRYDIFAPLDMHRQTVGIVGYGSIGRELARLAKALGMTVLASKRDLRHLQEDERDYTIEGTGDPAGEIPDRLYPSEALATMASECDYLVVTVPMTEATEHLINAQVLAAMKKSGVLINVARGGVVNEAALVRALNNGDIAGAALDVFEAEPLPADSALWQMENVILSPHVSGNSAHYHEKAAELFITNLKRYLDNKPLLNVLNRDAGY